jgi:hypothetical protein
MSFIESIVNVLIGYVVAVSAQVAIFPLFEINISLRENLEIGAIFMVVSISRSYLVRRLFNGR